MTAPDPRQVELMGTLPDAHKKHLDPASPLPMRMMAAKGMAPLPPKEMVIVTAGLAIDASESLAADWLRYLGRFEFPSTAQITNVTTVRPPPKSNS